MSSLPFSANTLEFCAQGDHQHAHGILKRAGIGLELQDLFSSITPDLISLLGEQSVANLLQAVLEIYPKTSASVIELIVGTSLNSAQKLGNPDSFKRYLALLEEIVELAPRGLRPMLARQDILLERLGIAGLQRWVRNGIERFSHDFIALTQYFSLQNEASWHMLNLESGNTLFIHERRRIELYLRALWGCEFKMQQFPVSTDATSALARTFVDEDDIIYLPDTFCSVPARPGKEVYRAASVHAAAHIVFSRQTFLRRKVNPMQNALIALIEDARVESLAMRSFPGLRNLWLNMYPQFHFFNTDFLSLTKRLTRALIDPRYVDENAWVKKGRGLFLAQEHHLDDPQISIKLGLLLANDMGQMRVKFNAPGYLIEPSYRDDNRVLWEPQGIDVPLPDDPQPDQNMGDPSYSSARTQETVGRQATEVTEVSSELFQFSPPPALDNLSAVTSFYYPEWDYQLGMERFNRARVIEKPCDEADISKVEIIEDRTKSILVKLKRINQAIRPHQLRRQKKQEEGDELDLDAVIRAAVDLRGQRMPDMRINSRFVRSVQQISVLLLLDLSESTNQRLLDTDKTILDLTRETAVLFGGTVSDLGDGFAIHGFSSNGRNNVEYYRLKDFGEKYDDQVKKRLSGMAGKFSTRLGAAARHAGQFLSQQSGERKILLIISDGEPADIDVVDAKYLVQDAAHAVKRLRMTGVDCFCINLNVETEPQVARIFGQRGYRVLNDVSCLPAILPAVYMRLRT